MKIYNIIDKIEGNIITLKAKAFYRETAMVGTNLATVIKIEGEDVSLQLMGSTKGLSKETKVQFLGIVMKIPLSDDVLGRIISADGKPIDKGPEIMGKARPIKGEVINPYTRKVPDKFIRTGIPSIDVYNSLVRGQKIPIFTVPGEPVLELLVRITKGTDADIIVIGGIGLKFDDYIYLREEIEKTGSMSKTTMVIHTAAEPVGEALMVPDTALTIAEYFSEKGKNVLVLLTDMTSWSNAHKEISITMEKVPANQGFPGDLYSQLAYRYEKAVEYKNGGSVTIISTTILPGGDVTHPVPDNTGYITEGQFYLQGGRIQLFGSLSRLKQQVNGKTREDHRQIMDATVKLYKKCTELREQLSMGFKLDDNDRKFLKFGDFLEKEILDFDVEMPLEMALDRMWEITAECFTPQQTGIPDKILKKYWPDKEESKN